jgi:hypothetical protein
MVTTVEDVQAVGPSTEVKPFADVIDQVESDAFRLEAATRALESGLQRALTLPLQDPKDSKAVEEFAAKTPGEISASKEAFVSDPQGSDAAASKADPEARLNDSIDRIKTIYMELANWHLAWGIAHKAQQDTSHILRGQ